MHLLDREPGTPHQRKTGHARLASLSFPSALRCIPSPAAPFGGATPRLSDRVQLFGTVTDSITGKPVYDCLVEYYDMAGERLSISSVNSDGQYAMYVPAHLPFELRIERENGYRDLRTSAPQIPEGTGQFRLDLVLHPK